MKIGVSFSVLAAVALLTGCAGPENKLGRGLNNMTEIIRGGDMHRSMEQTGLWESSASATTTGFVRGLTRTATRAGIGIYEVVTFPFPPYDPLLVPKNKLYPDHSIRTEKYPWGGLTLPEHPVFPAGYEPGLRAGLYDTDALMGFSGGEVAPGFPGSRFRIFDH